MKHIHKILIVLFGGMMASAYGVTCYLPQVVCCTAAGVSLAVITPTGCGAFTALLYSDEEAWRFDTYSVSLGGQPGPGTGASAYCDGTYVMNEYRGGAKSEAYLSPIAGDNNQNGPQTPTGYGMRVYYNDCHGATITGINGDPSIIVNGDWISSAYKVTTHYLSTTTATCN